MYVVEPTGNLFYSLTWQFLKHLMFHYPISIFGVTPAEQIFSWMCLHAFVIVSACQFLAVLLLLYWNSNGMQLKHIYLPYFNNMGTFL